MTGAAAVIAQLEPRAEGWLWWLVLVGGLLIVLLMVGVLRRRLLRPMRHTPSDTTDAWAEAGRRLATPPPGDEGDEDSEEPGAP